VRHADIDMCMVYDSYTITVLTTLEGLGFCAPGRGRSILRGRTDRLGGALPINTDGGGLSSNHPGHARHLPRHRGDAAAARRGRARRRCADAKLACVHGTGGMLGQRHSGATIILGRA
jgi:acetyl-CoA C-acetyltransferase